jgi:hypothetical protein
MPQETQKTIQCRRHPKSKQRTLILYRPTDTNWNTATHPLILPLKLGRKQSHPRIPMVHSFPTLDRLEERLDRPQPTTRHTPESRCGMSMVPTTTNQQSQDTTCRQDIHLQNGRQTKTHVGKPKHPIIVPHLFKSIFRRSVTRISTIPSLGPHNQT